MYTALHDIISGGNLASHFVEVSVSTTLFVVKLKHTLIYFAGELDQGGKHVLKIPKLDAPKLEISSI